MSTKKVKKPKPTHTIKITSDLYPRPDGMEGDTRYTSSVMRGDKLLWSSTSQLYSNKIDAVTPARNFIKACREGRVEIVS